jgi:molybdopterin converting factor subunit 1
MRIRLLYFASFRDSLGKDEEVMELPAGTSIASLWEELRKRSSWLRRFSSMPAVAVNCEYVAPARILAEDDEVAFLPPIAGG